MALIGEVYVGDILRKGRPRPARRGDRPRPGHRRGGGGAVPARRRPVHRERKRRYLPLGGARSSTSGSSLPGRREIPEAAPSKEHLLIRKDLLDKQIVDINGAKVVRVNDVRLTEEGGAAYVTDVDVGMRGILRRLGVEAREAPSSRRSATPAPPGRSPGSTCSRWSQARPVDAVGVPRGGVGPPPRGSRPDHERPGPRGAAGFLRAPTRRPRRKPCTSRAGGPGGPHLRDGQGAGGRHHRADAAGRGGGRHRGPPRGEGPGTPG